MTWTFIGGVAGGFLVAVLTKIGQESVTGFLALRNARRHVLDMLVTETSRGPGSIRTNWQATPIVTANHYAVSRATREALSTYLTAARNSPLRFRGDKRAVEAVAPRLQFETAEVGKIEFLAICRLMAPKRSARAIKYYAEITARAVAEVAYSLAPEQAEGMGSAARELLLDELGQVWKAMPARLRTRDGLKANRNRVGLLKR